MRISYSKIVYVSILLIFLGRFYQGVMLHDFTNPVLVTPLIDNTYWLLFFLSIPQTILGSTLFSWTIDIGLIALPVLLLFWDNRWLRFLLFPLLLLYIVSYASCIAFQGHGLYGLILVLLPLLFVGERGERWFEANRYYACFIFASAAIWKVFRGNIFDVDHFSNILKNQHASYFFYRPDGMRGNLFDYLIHHPEVSSLLLYGAVLLQLSFTVGFFTKRYDLFLALILLLFLIFNWLVMDISFWNMFVIVLLFLPWREGALAIQPKKVSYIQ